MLVSETISYQSSMNPADLTLVSCPDPLAQDQVQGTVYLETSV